MAAAATEPDTLIIGATLRFVYRVALLIYASTRSALHTSQHNALSTVMHSALAPPFVVRVLLQVVLLAGWLEATSHRADLA